MGRAEGQSLARLRRLAARRLNPVLRPRAERHRASSDRRRDRGPAGVPLGPLLAGVLTDRFGLLRRHAAATRRPSIPPLEGAPARSDLVAPTRE